MGAPGDLYIGPPYSHKSRVVSDWNKISKTWNFNMKLESINDLAA